MEHDARRWEDVKWKDERAATKARKLLEKEFPARGAEGGELFDEVIAACCDAINFIPDNFEWRADAHELRQETKSAGLALRELRGFIRKQAWFAQRTANRAIQSARHRGVTLSDASWGTGKTDRPEHKALDILLDDFAKGLKATVVAELNDRFPRRMKYGPMTYAKPKDRAKQRPRSDKMLAVQLGYLFRWHSFHGSAVRGERSPEKVRPELLREAFRVSDWLEALEQGHLQEQAGNKARANRHTNLIVVLLQASFGDALDSSLRDRRGVSDAVRDFLRDNPGVTIGRW